MKTAIVNTIENGQKVSKTIAFYKKHYVLPYGQTRKQTAKLELEKAECCGCGEPNKCVEWVFNDDFEAYELKNACDECFACGLLCGEDNENF